MKVLLTVSAALALFAPPADDPTRVEFVKLSDFDYTEGMELPGSVTKYNEKTIEISGFMAREVDGTGPVEFFMLINEACGCEGTPKLNEIIYCAMPVGKTTEILPGTVTITGTLFVGEEKEDGIVLGIYSLDVEKLR